MDIVKQTKPSLPLTWDYNKSVKDVKAFVYKWKNLSVEIAEELSIARDMLSLDIKDQPRASDGTFVPADKTWDSYCKDINVLKRVVNRWLKQWYGDLDKEQRLRDEQLKRLQDVNDIEIRQGDFKEVLEDIPVIDAIITDPPYHQEYIECFSELSLFASKHLKEDGFCIVYSGQYHLPEVINRLSEHLTYVWTFCLYHVGKKQLLNGVNIMCGWKPVLIFSNGRKKMRFSAYDVLISEQMEKFGHEWQQSESGVANLVEIFSEPGQLVADPFAGSGTFLKVAHEMNRNTIGAEINDKEKI